MNFLVIVFVMIALIAGVSLYRNGWDLRKAWEAVVVFGVAIGAAIAHLWSGGATP